MTAQQRGVSTDVDHIQVEMMGLLREPVPGQRWMPTGQQRIWRPPTDVYELESAVVVRIEIAGIHESDLDISVQDQFLIVRGTRADISERRAYHQMEIRYGEFGVEVQLPVPVMIDDAQAEYRNGFLVIHLPKQRAKQIRISDQ